MNSIQGRRILALGIVLCLLLSVGVVSAFALDEFVPDEDTLLLDHFEVLPNPDIDGAESDKVELVPGKFGNAIKRVAGGTLSYPAPGNIRNDQGTIEFWMNPSSDGGSGNRCLFTLYHSEAQRLYIRFEGPNTLYSLIWNDPEWIDFRLPVQVTFDEWHHYALTWSTDERGRMTACVYLDGQRIGEKTLHCTPPDLQGGRIWVGSYFKGAMPFNGLIDELRISSVVRYTGPTID